MRDFFIASKAMSEKDIPLANSIIDQFKSKLMFGLELKVLVFYLVEGAIRHVGFEAYRPAFVMVTIGGSDHDVAVCQASFSPIVLDLSSFGLFSVLSAA